MCDDGFDKNAADAICFHLGYQTGGSEWTSGLSWDVQDRYNIALDDVICKNTSWSSCSYAKSSDCTHSEDVFLTCSRQEGKEVFIKTSNFSFSEFYSSLTFCPQCFLLCAIYPIIAGPWKGAPISSFEHSSTSNIIQSQ